MQVYYESGEKQHSRAEQVHGRRDALLWAGAPRDEVTACEQAIGDEGNTKQRVDIPLRMSGAGAVIRIAQDSQQAQQIDDAEDIQADTHTQRHHGHGIDRPMPQPGAAAALEH